MSLAERIPDQCRYMLPLTLRRVFPMHTDRSREPACQRQLLRLALLVLFDHPVSQRQRGSVGAEVVVDKVAHCPVAAGERENQTWVGPAPFIDGLVVVANRHVMPVGGSQQVQHLGLDAVDILKLVH